MNEHRTIQHLIDTEASLRSQLAEAVAQVAADKAVQIEYREAIRSLETARDLLQLELVEAISLLRNVTQGEFPSRSNEVRSFLARFDGDGKAVR